MKYTVMSTYCIYITIVTWLIFDTNLYIASEKVIPITDFLKFVFILLDIGPAPSNFLLDPLNFCWTYIFYVKLF